MGRDRGAGDREKRGLEVYGRREKRGREAGFPRWREAGEKGKFMQHCAIFHNRKNAKRREPKNTGREPGLKGTGSGRFKPPCPPPPLSGILAKSGPLDFTTKNSFPLFFVCEKGLVHMYQNHFVYFPTLHFCFATSQKPILPATRFSAVIERLKFMDFERRATAN